MTDFFFFFLSSQHDVWIMGLGPDYGLTCSRCIVEALRKTGFVLFCVIIMIITMMALVKERENIFMRHETLDLASG